MADSLSPNSIQVTQETSLMPEPIDAAYAGALQISVISAIDMFPIEGATVVISYTGDPDAPIETLTTDSSGQTPPVELPAPALSLSLTPEPNQQTLL